MEKDILKNVEIICLDHKEFSEEAFESFQETLKLFNVYIYELESSKFSDTWLIAICPFEVNQDYLKQVDTAWQKQCEDPKEIVEGV